MHNAFSNVYNEATEHNCGTNLKIKSSDISKTIMFGYIVNYIHLRTLTNYIRR